MNSFNVNTLLEKRTFVSGAAFLTSGVACCCIGKFMKIEGAPFSLQLKCIALATVAQAIFQKIIYKGFETETEHRTKKECLVLRKDKEFNDWTKAVLSLAGPIVLTRLLVKKAAFKRPILMTAIISISYFSIHKKLSFKVPLVIGGPDFKDALLENAVPNRPVTIIDDYNPNVALEDCEGITWLPDELHISGDLNLKGCTGLRNIPKRLHLGGNLTLEGCTALTELPVGLEINGNLNLQGCTNLIALPRGLKIAGTLNIEGCTSISTLPDDMEITGDINAKGCTSLSTIPEGFNAQGDLLLEECTNIRSLPHGLNIGKRLSLLNCSNLLSVPEDLVVRGSLNLKGCIRLTELPEELNPSKGLRLDGCTGLTKLHRNHFSGNLILRGCTAIKELPKDLYVGDSLIVENVREISLLEGLKVEGYLSLENIEVCSLPRGLQVKGGLYLDNLNITEIPENLKHLSALSISNCPHLTTLPEDLVIGVGGMDMGSGNDVLKVLPRGHRVEGKLLIDEGSKIEEISDNLYVGGDLEVKKRSSGRDFSKFGNNTYIGGDLKLDRAYGSDTLPERMNVGGDISLFGCYTMQIPSWMKNLPPRKDGKKRSVMLYGTRISQQDVDDLRRAYDGREDIHISYPNPSLLNNLFRRDQTPFASAESQENLEILGFAPTAQPTEHDIKKAWHKISLEHHPDKSQEDGEIFKTATAAKEALFKDLADWNLRH